MKKWDNFWNFAFLALGFLGVVDIVIGNGILKSVFGPPDMLLEIKGWVMVIASYLFHIEYCKE